MGILFLFLERAECSNYKVLSDPVRSVHNIRGHQCDSTHKGFGPTNKTPDWAGTAWYTNQCYLISR